MKKLMFVLGLMGIVFISYAGENETGFAKSGIDKKSKNVIGKQGKDSNTSFVMCEVSQTAKVTVYFVEYTVKCTSTQTTCKAAIDESVACVTEAINKLKLALLKS